MNFLFDSKDVKLYSFYTFFSALVFEAPILIIFLLNRGLNYAKVSLIMAVYSISVFLFEYITGVIADKYSRKSCLIISGVFFIAGEMFFVFGMGELAFLIAVIIISISVAAKSGADSALLYDKLIELEKSHQYPEIISRLGSYMLLMGTLGSLIGPILFKYGQRLPFIATIIFTGIALFAMLGIQEATIEVKTNNRPAPRKDIVRKSIQFAIQNKVALGLILLTIVIFSGYHMFDYIFQPYLKSKQIPIEYFGAFYTGVILFQALGTRLTGTLIKRVRFITLLTLSSLMIILGIFLMTLEQAPVIVYFIPVIIGVPLGVFNSISDIAMNKLVESNIRASVLSLQHALSKVLQIILYLGIGFSLEHSSISFSILMLAMTLVVSVIIIFLCFRKSLDQGSMLSEKKCNG